MAGGRPSLWGFYFFRFTPFSSLLFYSPLLTKNLGAQTELGALENWGKAMSEGSAAAAAAPAAAGASAEPPVMQGPPPAEESPEVSLLTLRLGERPRGCPKEPGFQPATSKHHRNQRNTACVQEI